MKNYIFGYGSLIEKQSRLRTTPNATLVYPAEIYGFVRGWWTRPNLNGFSTTFLGCVSVKSTVGKFSHDVVNGVLYEVNEEELIATDLREASYNRQQIEHTNLNDYCSIVDPSSKIWIYLNKFSSDDELLQNLPCEKFPIVQSYVDICINGCIEIENEFPLAKKNEFVSKFIQSTKYWSHYWANDRIYPRRPFIHCPNAQLIDDMLKHNLINKEIFDNIYIE